MLFTYTVLDPAGSERQGEIEAVNLEAAINSLQHRGFVIASINEAGHKGVLNLEIKWLERVAMKELVIVSRQIATLFSSQSSATHVFQMLGAESSNPLLRRSLEEIAVDIQGGSSIAKAMSKHPKIFSEFYVNMVTAGEESGKLDSIFNFMADYLERTYIVVAKARSALIYPAFVITVFIGVMVLLLTQIIPKLAGILKDAGQEIPLYTRIVIGISDALVNYGLLVFIAIIVGGFLLVRYVSTKEGRTAFDRLKLSVPYVGSLFRALYLARISDNMYTMLTAGISGVRALEITADVVGNVVYKKILTETLEAVRGGEAISDALRRYEEIPGILVQMVRVGEETGNLGKILKTLALFYERELNNAVDAMISLIEPALIILLGVGVGVVVASVLIPIYNISTSI